MFAIPKNVWLVLGTRTSQFTWH